jgi:hypothetical protein
VTTNYDSDWRESINAEQNLKNATLFAQLEASLVMLDRHSIRFEYVETDEWFAQICRERGRGKETCFIQLAADLALAEQVEYLALAWQHLFPAVEGDWLSAWYRDEKDPADGKPQLLVAAAILTSNESPEVIPGAPPSLSRHNPRYEDKFDFATPYFETTRHAVSAKFGIRSDCLLIGPNPQATFLRD